VLPHTSTCRFSHLCRSRPRGSILAATHRGFAFYVAFPESSIPDRDVFYGASPSRSILPSSFILFPALGSPSSAAVCVQDVSRETPLISRDMQVRVADSAKKNFNLHISRVGSRRLNENGFNGSCAE
jgi:hypothetical protein